MTMKFIDETPASLMQHSDTARVEVTVVEEASISDAISAFKKFLFAAGYNAKSIEEHFPDYD